MNQQRHAGGLHRLEHRVAIGDVGQAEVRIGGGAGRVQLDRADQPFLLALRDGGRIGPVGQIERQQRRERGAGCLTLTGLQNLLAIGACARKRRDGRAQIRHHDGPGELRGGGRHNGLQRRTVAQMQVPVIGLTQYQGIDGLVGLGHRLNGFHSQVPAGAGSPQV